MHDTGRERMHEWEVHPRWSISSSHLFQDLWGVVQACRSTAADARHELQASYTSQRSHVGTHFCSFLIPKFQPSCVEEKVQITCPYAQSQPDVPQGSSCWPCFPFPPSAALCRIRREACRRKVENAGIKLRCDVCRMKDSLVKAKEAQSWNCCCSEVYASTREGMVRGADCLFLQPASAWWGSQRRELSR